MLILPGRMLSRIRKGLLRQIVAVAPVNVIPPFISGSGRIGEELVADEGAWSGYPSPAFTFQWQRNGVNIVGATTALYTPVTADDAATATCRVTATNSAGSTSVITAGVSIYAPPVNTAAPVISGSPYVDSVQSCSTGSWSGTPTLSFTYQWYRDGNAISGATSSSYTATLDDHFCELGCIVTAHNAHGVVSVPADDVYITINLPGVSGVSSYLVAGSAADFSETDGKISSWNRRGGSASMVNATAGERPVYDAVKGGVTFPATGQRLYTDADVTAANGGAALTGRFVAICFTSDAKVAQQNLLAFSPTGAAANANARVRQAAGSVFTIEYVADQAAGSPDFVSAADYTTGTKHIMALNITGAGNVDTFWDDLKGSSFDPNDTVLSASSLRLVIGARSAGAFTDQPTSTTIHGLLDIAHSVTDAQALAYIRQMAADNSFFLT